MTAPTPLSPTDDAFIRGAFFVADLATGRQRSLHATI